ncbi:unnamed protein product [Prorocentrum cordatum]|uniref:Uncharacterized protein n=1 Tax=Prorocentrum cordatum TaxID=2364126 RepID=A0ABN9P7V9_9DINO|nr:unnamed protein product [Polarella glacialis]|mmetsp:Transcript_94602/g.246401  ORF Transcript_94602/g.246401 Transcript_94602/m.246401 type:complete len:97 (+) Transcript_94602:87-377(+)
MAMTTPAAMSEGYEDFAAVRKVIEDKLHQEYYSVTTKDLPPRMQPRQGPTLQDAGKVDWDDYKSWPWMQPGWKGIKMHSQCVILPDGSAEVRSVWK